jgi:hypothetical protein
MMMIVLLLVCSAQVELVTDMYSVFLELDLLRWRQFLGEFIDCMIFHAYLLL